MGIHQTSESHTTSMGSILALFMRGDWKGGFLVSGGSFHLEVQLKMDVLIFVM